MRLRPPGSECRTSAIKTDPLRQLKAHLHQVPAPGPRKALVEIQVRFGSDEGNLASAASEGTGHHDGRIWRRARRRFAFVPDQQLKLVEQRRAQNGLLGVGDLLL